MEENSALQEPSQLSDVVSQEPVQEENTTTASNPKQPVKHIFVGTVETSVFTTIKENIKQILGGDYKVMILDSTIYHKMRELVLFDELNEIEKNNQLQLKRDRASREKAFDIAKQLQGILENYKKVELLNVGFTQPELYSVYNAATRHRIIREKLSNTQVWQIMDFLLLQGYLHPVTVDVAVPRHKRIYRLVTTPDRSLESIKEQIGKYNGLIDTYKQALKDLKKQEKQVIKEKQQMLQENDTTKSEPTSDSNEHSTA
jgi:hypothetical protein